MPLYSATGDAVQFEARVLTTDAIERKLTFYGIPDIVYAPETCVIFAMESGTEIILSFADIQVDDSVKVCGVRQDDNSVLANRIRIYGECDSDPCDLHFRDTIVSIDYALGTFSVAGRSELIAIDENTLIWGNILEQVPGGLEGSSSVIDDGLSFGKARPDANYHYRARDTLYEFTDLAVGDIVEIGADIIDSETLLARSIKLVDCQVKICAEFSANIATLDCGTRAITFEGLNWIGEVCPGAELLDIDGDPILLCDFSAGDYVTVKGFPQEGDALFICSMIKTIP